MPSVNGKSRKKRAIWLEANVDFVAHVSLDRSDKYDHNRAYELLIKHKDSKPLAKCKLQCFFDLIKMKRTSAFGSQPPRKQFLYRDVERFYCFSDYSTMLVLGCITPDRARKHYDVFRMTEQQIQNFCDLVSQAHNHPMFILSEQTSAPVRYQSSQSSLAADAEPREEPELSLPAHEERIVIEGKSSTKSLSSNSTHSLDEPESKSRSLHIEPEHSGFGSTHSLEHITELQHNVVVSEHCAPAATVHAPSFNEPNKPKRDRSPIPSHMKDDPLFNSLCEHVKEDDVWAVDMAYIDVHPKYGSQLASTGPTYLFVAHHKSRALKRGTSIGSEKSWSERLNLSKEDMEQEEKERWQQNSAGLGFTTTYVHC